MNFQLNQAAGGQVLQISLPRKFDCLHGIALCFLTGTFIKRQVGQLNQTKNLLYFIARRLRGFQTLLKLRSRLCDIFPTPRKSIPRRRAGLRQSPPRYRVP